MGGTAVLDVTGLVKRFGDLTAVDDVSFSIAEGETFGLLGPNGAGKTTTISMIAGVLAADAGEVRIDGRPHGVRSLATKSSIGYVPQELALYPDLSGKANLRFFARLYGLSGRDAESRVGEALEVVGLADRAGDKVEKYSGGMARRLNIAAGLLNRPRLLILDEPTAGVDPQSRNAILENIERLTGEGIAVLYTTHYMEEAERLCDRVAIMDAGRVLAEGTRRELVDLVGGRDQVLVGADGELSGVVGALEALPNVLRVDRSTDGADSADTDGDGRSTGRLELLVTEARSQLPTILEAMSNAGGSVRSVEVIEPDLEAVFLHLTGKALRD